MRYLNRQNIWETAKMEVMEPSTHWPEGGFVLNAWPERETPLQTLGKTRKQAIKKMAQRYRLTSEWARLQRAPETIEMGWRKVYMHTVETDEGGWAVYASWDGQSETMARYCSMTCDGPLPYLAWEHVAVRAQRYMYARHQRAVRESEQAKRRPLLREHRKTGVLIWRGEHHNSRVLVGKGRAGHKGQANWRWWNATHGKDDKQK
jgi:hypothetical protein